jgi:predicted bacteriocin transport accessory protein
MKKFWLAILLIFITGCNYINSYQEISLSTLEKKVNNKDSFVLIIGSSTCSHCETYKYTIDEIIKENQINIYYIDINEFDETKLVKLKSFTNFVSDYEIGTPITLFFKDGVEDDNSGYNRIEGDKDKTYVENKLRLNGYIK